LPSPALPRLPRPLLDQAIHFSFATLLLFSSLSLTLCNKNDNQKSNNDDIKDLNFLEEPDDVVATSHYNHFPDPNQFDKDGDNDEDKFSDFAGFDHSLEEAFKESKVDDKDVIIFKKHNFTIAVKNNCFVMVKLYVPWCSHYQALTPKYTVATTELKPNSVILTKVNATVEKNWRASTMFMVSPPSSSSSMGFTSPTLAKEPSKTRCTFWIFQFRSQLSVIAF